jgi:hypothetical protein
MRHSNDPMADDLNGLNSAREAYNEIAAGSVRGAVS